MDRDIRKVKAVKVTKEKSAEHHEAIIAAGSRLFRERGFDGVGVVEIMNAAGLTHGAFYGHFASKDALCAEACKRAFDDLLEVWDEKKMSFSKYIDGYLSVDHRDSEGSGCPVASLSPQMKRQKRVVQKQFAKGVSEIVDRISIELPGGGSFAQKRKTAAGVLSAMVGGVVLARATVNDRALSGQILADCRASIAAKFGV